MWLFTEHGFYSIVKKAKGQWHVRARVHADLLRLAPLLPGKPEVQMSYPGSDYPWRIIIDSKQKTALFRILSKVEYGNFKGRVAEDPEQASRLPVYHEVWRLMAGVTGPVVGSLPMYRTPQIVVEKNHESFHPHQIQHTGG